MKKSLNTARLIAIAGLYIAIALVYLGRLVFFQVSGQDYYTMSTPSRTYTRTVAIQAQRGEICDRNGKKIVKNIYKYDIFFDYNTEPVDETEFNDMIIDTVRIAERLGDGEKISEPRISINVEASESGLSFSYVDGLFETARGRRLNKLLGELNVKEPGTDCEADSRALLLYYGILTRERIPDTSPAEYEYYYNYPYEVAKILFEYRLDMSLTDHSSVQPYQIGSDVSIETMSACEEKYSRGYLIKVRAEREYLYPGYASHILGFVKSIPGEQVEYYTSLGYPLDAKVGISGVEQAFEEYLRGQDGILAITEDEYGNILSTEVKKEPIAGQDVYLTIDMDMQIVAENALAENIFRIRSEANPDKPLTGEDASAGALNVLDRDTGEILAIASYPTYDLTTYSEDFAALSQDETKPYLNRALSGTYAPGSTFKVGVAVAALTEGVITEDTIIDAQGEYMYYASSGFTPRCWIYLLSGGKHGKINVVEAIQESCNYFFYEVGRILTIDKMNEYCRHYGLGESTGIELSERKGILAGPEYREENGLGQWSPGDTLQAAIGQSDNLFNPLQISSYISTILNGGVRYSCHLLKEVHEFGTNTITYSNSPKAVDSFELSPKILEIVKEGMKGVMDNGSAASVFSGYEISVGGKTGTAQVYEDKSDNGIMTAFAPFENPEIVVTCVIEQGSGGTEAGYAVKDVFDYYFGIGKWKPADEDETEDGENTQDESEIDGENNVIDDNNEQNEAE